MIVVDVNVLVAAAWQDHEFHQAAAEFLSRSLEHDEVAVPDVVWSRLIRTATNPRVIQPTPDWPSINRFIQAIRSHPSYRMDVRAMTSPITTFLVLCGSAGVKGNLVSDAYIAAIAMDYDATVATWDTDFERFPVQVVHPPLAIG